MTALRIFATSRPSLIGQKLQPMSKEDAEFWRLLRNRRSEAGPPVKLRSVK
jgi:hypothetical protein